MECDQMDAHAFASLASFSSLASLPSLGLFLMGYLLILIVPGPNMIVIFTVASTYGLRRAVPIVAAVGAGSATLLVVMAIGATMGLAQDRVCAVLAVISGSLVIFAAWRLLHLRPPAVDRTRRAGCVSSAIRYGKMGFSCSLTNPVTAAYFMSAILNPDSVWFRGPHLAVTCASVLVLAITINLLVARILSLNAAQNAAHRMFWPLKIGAAAMVIGMGAYALHPYLGPVRRMLVG